MNDISKSIIGLLASILFLGACSVSRPPVLSDASIPSTYRGSTASDPSTADSSSIAQLHWNEFFTDRTLLALIDTAIANNYDIRLAVKNIESARLLLTLAKAGYLPDVSLQVGANTSRPSDNSLNGLSLSQFLGSKHIEDYTAAVSISWEADIWGKIKNQKAAALAGYLQTEEVRKAVQTQLVAQIAQGYFNLLMLREQLAIARQNLLLNDSTLQVINQQYKVGDVTSLGLEQAQAQKLAAASLIPGFEQDISIQENALRILSGEFPDSLPTEKRLADIAVPQQLASGYPAMLLGRRPDVRQAELAINQAQANSKVARANLYPSLAITAQGGVNAFEASNWFNIPASLFGTVAGNLTQPILQRKRLTTNYKLALVEQEKSVLQFRQSVLKAVGEVSDALAKLDKLNQRQKIVLERTQRLQSAIHQADLLYKTGMANYLEVITSQSNVLQSELELADVKRLQLFAVVDLYRSLGGGWE
ncbi:efflux transporter, outer membrane factor (OMF) lipoprotein, NodT family [bacterium A37T11]|nr:efflux transporter, outer membrane factor (OMF) lipoprotein, NodT family [bacterium A37T11]